MFLLTSLIHENKVNNIPPEVPEELIVKIANQDKEALHQLYEIANKAVYGFAYSILKNVDDSQDVLQDTFIKIYAYAKSYKCQGKPMAWILRITRNLALTKIRDGKKTISSDVEENAADLSYSQFDDQSENKMILHNLLSNLSDESRQIVVLHAVTGLRHREIAEVMDLSLTNVLSKYNRAIKKLRKILTEDRKNG